MATPYQIHVPASDTGLLGIKQRDETARKLSDLLQQDLDSHHVFFNNSGFHNHIVHHILSLYGTGADASAIQRGYDANASYQRQTQKTHPGVADALATDWPTAAPKHLGNESRYPDFLLFFQREIENAASHPDVGAGRLRPHEVVLATYLFAGDARADDLLQRMFAGFLHPLIQLMYGVEWSQPAIVAEGLAQAAVHKNELKRFLEDAEAQAESKTTPMPAMTALYEEIAGTEKLRQAARMEDSNKIYDGVLVRAPREMMDVVKQVRVRDEELEEKTAEMFESAIWAAAGAALRPGKKAKWDFFLIHHVNSAPFFLGLNKLSWLSTANKVRILEWKIRMDLVQYVARSVPELRFDGVKDYQPEDVREGKRLVAKPQDLLPAFHDLEDDGHTIKLVRALSIYEELSKKYDDKPWRKIRGDDVWLNLHYMVLDGARILGANEGTWVRGAGLDEAWKDVPDRK